MSGVVEETHRIKGGFLKRHFLWSISFAVLIAGCSRVNYNRIGMDITEWNNAVRQETLLVKDSQHEVWQKDRHIYYFTDGKLVKIERKEMTLQEKQMKLEALRLMIQQQQGNKIKIQQCGVIQTPRGLQYIPC